MDLKNNKTLKNLIDFEQILRRDKKKGLPPLPSKNYLEASHQQISLHQSSLFEMLLLS